jgi:hypothetical protein
MLRPNRAKYGTDGVSRISSVLIIGWMVFGCSCPASADEGRHLKLAPIRVSSTVGGNIGFTYFGNNFGKSRNSSKSLGVNVNYKVRATSYFWQPWFAEVSGGLGVFADSSITNYSPPPTTTKSANAALTGDFQLDMLKYSRFPFMARVYKSGNHSSGTASGINSDHRNKGYELSQEYRSLNGRIDSLAHFVHNNGGRASFGTEEAQDQLNLFLSALPFQYQSLRVSGNFIDTSHPLLGDSFISDALSTNHLYQPNATFSIASLLDLIKTDYTLKPGNVTLQQNNYNSQQLSSYASWRPIASPLTMTSSVRLYRSDYGTNSSPLLRSDATNFNLGANYAWSPLLRTYGSVNVYDDNKGIQTVSSNAALAAQKMFGSSEGVKIGDYRYTRYGTASLANSTVTSSSNLTTTPGSANLTKTTSVQSLGGNLGHGLSKSTNLDGGIFTINLNQTFSEVLSTRHTPFSHLGSNGSWSWSRSAGRETTIFRLTASDSRDLSGRQSFFQLINLQATRDVLLIRHQSLNGNLTIQTTRSGYKAYGGYDGLSTPLITSPSASVRYDNQKLFSVLNLTLTSALQLTAHDIVSSQTNQSGYSPMNTSTVAWDNDVNYFIGRLRIRALLHIAEVNNSTQSSLWFTMNRGF